MKKIIVTALVSLLILNSICAASKKSFQLEPIEFDLPTAQGNDFNYAIDPRVEIVGIIGRLAEYPEYSQNYQKSSDLLSQIDTIYAKQKDHKVVKAFKNFKNQKKIPGDALLNLAYHIKPDFSGTTVDFSSNPPDLNPELKKLSAKQLNEAVTLIHDFAVDTNFKRICAVNRGYYVSDLNWMKEDIEKCHLKEWAKDFFNDDEFSNVTITVSQIVCGFNFYDYASGEDGNRKCFITIYPGVNYFTLYSTYSVLYTQKYATKNWDELKEPFTKYVKDFAKKLNPANEKEIDKEEIYDNVLANYIANYCVIDYYAYRSSIQDEEDIQKYGDYSQGLDSIKQYFEKSYGNDATKAIQLLSDYRCNRDKYPTFLSFEPKVNDFIKSLKVE